MAVPNANLVLMVTHRDIIKSPREYVVRRRGVLLFQFHLQRLPWRVTKRSDYIDRRMHACLSEGDGRAVAHRGMDRDV